MSVNIYMLAEWFIKHIGATVYNGFSVWIGKYQKTLHMRLWYSREHSCRRTMWNAYMGVKSLQLGLWLVRYNEQGLLPWHSDSDRPCWVMITEIKKCKTGGQLEFENTNYRKIGRFYFFRGDKVKHRLTRIKKGTRWITMCQIGV